MSILDRLSDAFSNFMTVDDDGEPSLSCEDLPSAMEEAGLPSELAPKLRSRMDPKNTGWITFENFVTVAVDISQKEQPSQVFRLLADPETHLLTEESMRKAANRLKIHTTPQDITRLLEMSGNNPTSFAALQRRLDDMFGPEVGSEVSDLPDTQSNKT